jgi:hypothetical protein
MSELERAWTDRRRGSITPARDIASAARRSCRDPYHEGVENFVFDPGPAQPVSRSRFRFGRISLSLGSTAGGALETG